MTAARIGAGLVVAVAAAVALGGLYVLVVPIDSSTFAGATSVEWETFASEQPSVAEYLRSEGQLIGLSNIALGLVSLALVWTSRRAGDRVALRLADVTAYLLAVVVLAAGSSPDIAAFYAFLAGAAAVGLLLLERDRAPRA